MPSATAETRAAGAALDLHEGISTPSPPNPPACKRWPDRLRLSSSDGQLVRGRCKATNLCPYCQTLYVVETSELLTLDAMEWPPTLWAVLTAREHLTRRDTYRHLEFLRRAVKRRWPRCEWFVQVEFQRRGALHLNLLVKGVPRDDLDAFREVVVRVWCARVDALPIGQWAGEIDDPKGTVRYISKMLAHGLKAEQSPPLGWKGHRTSQTRGYLVRPASEMRLEARRSLKLKRALWRGVPADLLELELERESAVEWRLIEVRRLAGSVVVEPLGEVIARPEQRSSSPGISAGRSAIRRGTLQGPEVLSASRPSPSGVAYGVGPSDTGSGVRGSLAAATTPPPADGGEGFA